jgi:hypothetical protein
MATDRERREAGRDCIAVPGVAKYDGVVTESTYDRIGVGYSEIR